MTSAPPQTPTPKPESPPQRFRVVKGLVTVVVRLLLLGGSAGAAAGVGIAAAHWFPAQVAEPPLLERGIQRVEQWQGMWRQRLRGMQPAASEAELEAARPAPSPIALTAAERQLVQAELDQMQGEIQDLRDRTAQLESRLAFPATSEPLENRLRQMQQALNPDADPTSPVLTAPTRAIANGTNDRALQITLPSDALFEAEGALLRPSARAILDSIALDLRAYPGASVQVGAHTDSAADPATQRMETFEQARAVQQHLRTSLGDDYQWLSVGYGQTQPLTTEATAVARQRNRRVEIMIIP